MPVKVARTRPTPETIAAGERKSSGREFYILTLEPETCIFST